MIKKEPKVSIIMGVFNCEDTLVESIDSLLKQTFQDFNIIMCDDGSTDNTYIIANQYCERYPDKLILLKNSQNMGLNYTLNVCLEQSTGEYIARMDGDDISLPNRLKKQVEFLDKHNEFHIVSSAMIYFDETGDWGVGKPCEYPQEKNFAKGTPFAHAPCMVRREAFEAVDGYTTHKRLLRVEDYHLWIKMYSKGFKGYNIQEPLYKMRDDRQAVKRRDLKSRLNEAYVKIIAIKELNLPIFNIFYVIRPIILALTPEVIYIKMHKYKLRVKEDTNRKVDK